MFGDSSAPALERFWFDLDLLSQKKHNLSSTSDKQDKKTQASRQKDNEFKEKKKEQDGERREGEGEAEEEREN